MADLDRRDEPAASDGGLVLDEDRRGQVLLVTGFALAVVFVGLALVFNSVIYTENLATRSESTTTSDPVLHKRAVEIGTERIIEYVNEVNATNATRASVEENVTRAFDNMSDLMTQHQLGGGQIVDDRVTEIYEASWLRQTNRTRNFTSVDNESDWTLVTDARDVRSFRIIVSEPSELDGNLTPGSLESEEPFNLTVTGSSGDEFRLNVSDPSLSHFSISESFAVGYTKPSGETGICGVDSTPFVINVTAGTINGTSCPGLAFDGAFSTDWEMRFNHGANINGSYRMLVNRTGTTTVNTGNFGDPPHVPFTDPAVYGARVEVDYESSVLRYVTDFRVIPGETDA